MQTQPVIQVLRRNNHHFHPVVPFDHTIDKLVSLDLTENNTDLTEDIFNDTEKFGAYIDTKISNAHCKYAIGGYNELRTVYGRSELFGAVDNNSNGERGEPRRLHLGIDVWGKAGTPIYAFTGGMIHSFAFNNHYGDYGATLIILHQLEGIPFYTLYGHLALRDIGNISAGHYVNMGQVIGHFGEPEENGHWPPHLHIQIIIDIELRKGDYPGVCKYSERQKYLDNCPDPDLILQMTSYAKK